jgi:secreted PhoX family phosphatase
LLRQNGVSYAAPGDGAYGPLAAVADLRDGVSRLALPAGFQYRSFGVAGEMMTDGNPTPLAHDGMAAFQLPNGNVRLIRNHEDRATPAGLKSVLGDPTKKYDSLGGGGCTSLEVNPVTRQLVSDFVSINGTIVNCAGGPTPWGSWLTCEETTAGTPQGWGKPHGYVFDVPVLAGGPVQAIPLTQMGRFSHEAVAVDPASGIVYETEDAGLTSGFYRYIPDVPGQLGAGKLQMLAIKGNPNYDTTTGQKEGKPLPVEWVDIANPDPALPGGPTVFAQGAALGGAKFARLEGCWYGDGAIYFVSTSGGDEELGQIWEYRILGNSGGQVTLIFESTNADDMDAPDNITVTPRQGLLICQDGDGFQYLWGLTQKGGIFDFAQNLETQTEFAGACFSPDGQTLFVNRQGDTALPLDAANKGMTFAIWGPWENGAL